MGERIVVNFFRFGWVSIRFNIFITFFERLGLIGVSNLVKFFGFLWEFCVWELWGDGVLWSGEDWDCFRLGWGYEVFLSLEDWGIRVGGWVWGIGVDSEGGNVEDGKSCFRGG